MVERVVCAAAMALCISFSPLNSQSLWHWQYPPPQGNDLNDVDLFAPSAAVAVGNLGVIITSTDGGATWMARPTVAGQPNLHGVSFVDATTMVAVGELGTIVRSSDGGATWLAKASGTAEHLLDVDFADALHGTAVGRGGTIVRSDDGGDTWSAQTSSTTAPLYGVCFVNAMTGTAVGSGGTILRTTDGGTTWAPQTADTHATLRSVDFVNTSIGMAVGDGPTALLTKDGGAHWARKTVPDYPYVLYAVDVAGWITALAVGEVATDIGGIIRTDDEGASWNVKIDTAVRFFGVATLSSGTGIVVGAAGAIRRTMNGGYSWSAVGGGVQRYAMQAVDFFDPQRGAAVSRERRDGVSRAYATTDAGATWVAVAPFVQTDLHDVAFADASTIYAVGDGLSIYDYGASIWRSDNGGTSWTEIFSILCWPGNPFCIWSLRSIDFADAGTGVAVGSSGAIVEIVGGTPAQVTSPTGETLNAVSVPTTWTACAVGDNGTIIVGTPGGLWLTKYSGTTVRLNDVCFVDDLNGTAVGDAGTILRTGDGGNNWLPQISNKTADLTGVSFLNANDGIIAAGTSILKTRDGGYTWVPEDVPIDAVDLAYRDAVNVTAVGGDECIVARWDGPVPVFFQEFTAVAHPSAVELTWAVSADEGVRGFYVYRSASEGTTGEVNVTPGRIAPDERSFVDEEVVPGGRYRYTLVAVDGRGTMTRSQPVTAEVPRAALALLLNRPNPFNPSTTIRFTLPARMHVTLTVHDASGRRVAKLVDEFRGPGEQEVLWEAVGAASGVYFCRIDADGVVRARKMVLLK